MAKLVLWVDTSLNGKFDIEEMRSGLLGAVEVVKTNSLKEAREILGRRSVSLVIAELLTSSTNRPDDWRTNYQENRRLVEELPLSTAVLILTNLPAEVVIADMVEVRPGVAVLDKPVNLSIIIESSQKLLDAQS